MSCNLEHILEKALHIACEGGVSAHHLIDHKHCKHIVEPAFKQVSQCASKIAQNEKIYSTSANINAFGKVICEFDEQIASGVCSVFSKSAPMMANKAKDVLKVAGPVSVGIGLIFVVADVVKAPEDKKLERLGKSSAKLALTTGATVLGSCVLGPVGAFVFSLGASFLGDFLDGH
jgi:hypothetical protein